MLVSAMHITAGVYVNDWENGLIHDFQVWLEKLAPVGPRLSASSDGRRQRRRASEAHADGTSGDPADHRRQTGSRPVGAGLLRGVRWAAEEARRREGDGGVTDTRRYPGAAVRRGRRRDRRRHRVVALASSGCTSRWPGQWSLPGGASKSAKRWSVRRTRDARRDGPGGRGRSGRSKCSTGSCAMRTARAYHFVLVDYLCWPTGGTLQAGSDVDAAI